MIPSFHPSRKYNTPISPKSLALSQGRECFSGHGIGNDIVRFAGSPPLSNIKTAVLDKARQLQDSHYYHTDWISPNGRLCSAILCRSNSPALSKSVSQNLSKLNVPSHQYVLGVDHFDSLTHNLPSPLDVMLGNAPSDQKYRVWFFLDEELRPVYAIKQTVQLIDNGKTPVITLPSIPTKIYERGMAKLAQDDEPMKTVRGINRPVETSTPRFSGTSQTHPYWNLLDNGGSLPVPKNNIEKENMALENLEISQATLDRILRLPAEDIRVIGDLHGSIEVYCRPNTLSVEEFKKHLLAPSDTLALRIGQWNSAGLNHWDKSVGKYYKPGPDDCKKGYRVTRIEHTATRRVLSTIELELNPACKSSCMKMVRNVREETTSDKKELFSNNVDFEDPSIERVSVRLKRFISDAQSRLIPLMEQPVDPYFYKNIGDYAAFKKALGPEKWAIEGYNILFEKQP